MRGRHSQSDPWATAGFTIIEVLIVLALASLIILIVFEAVPTLTRDGRNNQRKQDVTAILQAVSHFELNNSADFPQPADNFLRYTTLSYYDKTNPAAITLHGQTPPALQASAGPESNAEYVEIWNYERCDPDHIGQAIDQGTDYTNIVALYAVDGGNGSTVGQCQQL